MTFPPSANDEKEGYYGYETEALYAGSLRKGHAGAVLAGEARIAKEAGYDFVEISIDATEGKIARVYSSRAERKQLVDWMYELDMPIRTLNASALTKFALGDPDPAVRGRGIDIASHAIGLPRTWASGS